MYINLTVMVDLLVLLLWSKLFRLNNNYNSELIAILEM